MGAYINLTDIAKRIEHTKLAQLTDDAKTGNVDADVVNEIITEAEGLFDSSARAAGYSLPVPATQMVRGICLDVAVFKLYERRATATGGVFDVKEKAYTKAIAFLKRLQERKEALDVPAKEETETNPASPDRVLSGPSKPATFSDDNLGGF
jgi:phage gp36-like protein